MNKFYTLLEISAAYNRPPSTTWKHINQLKDENKFEKKSLGSFYNSSELKQLERLLGFKFVHQK